MIEKTIVRCTALLVATLVFAAQTALAADGNLLEDASFELKLPPDEGGWILFDESMVSEDTARSGSRSMFNWGFSRTVPYPPYFVGTVAGSFQEFPADPGSRWRLTGYGQSTAALEGTPAFGIVQVSFFDALGKDLGTIETAADNTTRAKTSNEVNSQTAPGEWVLLDTGIATAPAGSATIQAFTLYVDFSGSNTSQGVYFDDLTLCHLAEGDDGSGCGQLGGDTGNSDD